MIIRQLRPLTDFETNSYLVISEKGNAALIDAPGCGKYILDAAGEYGCTITKLLLTHGHCDHIGAAAYVQEKTGCQVYIHKADEAKLSDPVGNLVEYFGLESIAPPKNVVGLSDGDEIQLDEIVFRVMHTPGHTSGSVCYIAENAMFSGDTLFNLSIGRTDMPDGDYKTLAASLVRLKELSGSYDVYPGHMGSTTLDYERRCNPYLF